MIGDEKGEWQIQKSLKFGKSNTCIATKSSDKRGFAIISQFNENRLMIISDASLFKVFFQNAKTYPDACQTSKMDFFLEYSQKLKAVYYFHKNRVKSILNTTLECIVS